MRLVLQHGEKASSMENKPFRKHVEFIFEINGDFFAIEPNGENLCIRETRNNGQEDTHMNGYIIRKTNTAFQWEEGESSFARYGYKHLPNKIIDYLNEHIDWINNNICTE